MLWTKYFVEYKRIIHFKIIRLCITTANRATCRACYCITVPYRGASDHISNRILAPKVPRSTFVQNPEATRGHHRGKSKVLRGQLSISLVVRSVGKIQAPAVGPLCMCRLKRDQVSYLEIGFLLYLTRSPPWSRSSSSQRRLLCALPLATSEGRFFQASSRGLCGLPRGATWFKARASQNIFILAFFVGSRQVNRARPGGGAKIYN